MSSAWSARAGSPRACSRSSHGMSVSFAKCSQPRLALLPIVASRMTATLSSCVTSTPTSMPHASSTRAVEPPSTNTVNLGGGRWVGVLRRRDCRQVEEEEE